MVQRPPDRRLTKELSLFAVFAIATGTTLSAGFFLLPSLAVDDAGPAVVVCYVIAAVLLVPAMLSIVELATAMPRAGGAYYFLDRSLGPLAGTVGGLGTWSALVLKSAFALYGMGAYVHLVWHDAPIRLIAAILAVAFGVVNLLGARGAGRLQLVLVMGLLAILAGFIAGGLLNVDTANFAGVLDQRPRDIFATAGLVFISYVGLTKVASVAEEVKNPERNLPLGIFLALGTAVVVYALGVGVMVGVVGPVELSGTRTPVELTAVRFAGRTGGIVVSIAALLAFTSVANAGILAASRYPLAMARDHLVPSFFRRLGGRGMPGWSIFVTVGGILLFLVALADPTDIAKLASAFQLLMFGLLCLAVIVMRESGLEAYDPGFRSPFYPWMQIAGLIAPIPIIVVMGPLALLFSLGLVAMGIAWYVTYARRRVERHGAVYHVFERLGRRRFPGLDSELRSILKEKGVREDDPFEQVIARASVIEAGPQDSFEDLVRRASELLARRVHRPAGELVERFLEGTKVGATPVTGGMALPHLRLRDIDDPQLVVVRCPEAGIEITAGSVHGEDRAPQRTHAVFFLVSPERDPARHLRLLAQIAGQVDQDGFLAEWRAAPDEHSLKETLLRNDRFVTLNVAQGTASEPLVGRAIRDVGFPDGCLVAVIRRGGETIVPLGGTVLEAGDWLTIIGSSQGVRETRRRFGPPDPESGPTAP